MSDNRNAGKIVDMKRRVKTTGIRLGPAGRGRRTGTVVMGGVRYSRKRQTDENRREIREELDSNRDPKKR